MDLLKKFFPYSFGVKDVQDLIIKIIVYVVGMVIISAVCAIIGLIPFIGGIIAWLIGTVCNLYLVVGLVLVILDYLKVLK